MAWIKVITIAQAGGLLKRQYDAAIKRASKVWNIVSIMGLNPQAMQDSMGFYRTIMCSASPHYHAVSVRCWLLLFLQSIIVRIEYVLMQTTSVLRLQRE